MRSTLVTRLLWDPKFQVRVARFLLGRPMPLEGRDRTILETIIFPYFRYLPGVQSVLFVGCDWYTAHYEDAYFAGKDYWTLDPAPGARKFAGRQHVVAPLEELGKHFPPQRFDLIVCNGVLGYGLDALRQCESAFDQCRTRLTPDGFLVLGWDDIAERTPVPLAAIQSLRAFSRFDFPPLGTWRYLSDTPYRHTYDFYRAGPRIQG